MGVAVMSKLYLICDGNGHVSPARKMKFEFDHTFGHPIEQIPFQIKGARRMKMRRLSLGVDPS